MTDTLYQYDYGQKLKIENVPALPQTFEAHFSNVQHGGVSITITGMDGIVDIPNTLLMTGKRIYCWIYVTEPGSGETEYQILLPVQARPMPEYYDVTDVGVFDSVVQQVGDYAATATAGATNATASATAAATSASEAAASASAAETAKTAAKTAQGKAEDAQAAAETAAQTATEKAQQTAQDAAQAASDAGRAESAAQSAEAAQTGAESAKTDAETAAQGAATSASAASASATSAGQAATSAAQSATAAAGSATTAQGAAQTATTKAGEASASASAAAASETAAQTAQTAAETAATNAGQSASTATTKAAEAAQSASDAQAAAARAEAAILDVDTELSTTSIKPVQNKVITGAVNTLEDAIKAGQIIAEGSGGVTVIEDGALNVPVRRMDVELEYYQDLHGQDSPYPAGGGKNIYDDSALFQGAYKQTTGELQPGYENYRTVIIDNLPAGTYTFSTDLADCYILREWMIDANHSIAIEANVYTFTMDTDGKYMLCFRKGNSTDITEAVHVQIELGSTATDYAPYSNICPITGVDTVTVHQSGKNLFDEANAVIYPRFFTEANTWVVAADSTSVAFPCIGAVEYTVSAYNSELTIFRVGTIDHLPVDNRDTPAISNVTRMTSSGSVTIIPYTGAKYIIIQCDKSIMDEGTAQIQIELGSATSDYEPYYGRTISVPLGQTVYGGNYTVTSGALDVTSGYVDLGTLTWTYDAGYGDFSATVPGMWTGYNWADPVSNLATTTYGYNTYAERGADMPDYTFSVLQDTIVVKDPRYTDATAFASAVSGVSFTYGLDAPVRTQLSPQVVRTYGGYNAFWSNGDNITIDYVVDTGKAIEASVKNAGDFILHVTENNEGDYDVEKSINDVNAAYESGKSIFCRVTHSGGDVDILPLSHVSVSYDDDNAYEYWFGGIVGNSADGYRYRNNHFYRLNAIYGVKATAIAPLWSDSELYTVGDYVMADPYDTNTFALYKCTTDTSGDFDSGAWEESTVYDMMRGMINQ